MLGRSLAGLAIANAAALGLMGSVRDDNIFVIDGDGHYDPRSDLQKTADEISNSLNSGLIRHERTRQPDPARQSAAELKRQRKADRLKAWAAKGAIGVQVSDPPEQPEEAFAKAKTHKLGDTKPQIKRPARKKADPFPGDKVEAAAKPKKAPAKKPAAAPGKKGMPAAKKPVKKTGYEA